MCRAGSGPKSGIGSHSSALGEEEYRHIIGQLPAGYVALAEAVG